MTTKTRIPDWSLLTNAEMAAELCRVSGCPERGAEHVVRTWVERGWSIGNTCYPAIRGRTLRRRSMGRPAPDHLAWFTPVIEAWLRG